MYNNKEIKGKDLILIVIKMLKKIMVMLISLIIQETKITTIIITMIMRLIIRETTKGSRKECNKEVAIIINIELFGDCCKIKKIAKLFFRIFYYVHKLIFFENKI